MKTIYLKAKNKIARFHNRFIRVEDHIDYLRYHDPLTQLPNREKLITLFNETVKVKKDQEYGIVIANIDRLHSINELYGRRMGDQVIVELTKRLKKTFKNENTVFKGDHFYLCLKDVAVHELHEIGAEVQKTINEILQIDEKRIRVTVSIGMSHYPVIGDNIESLLQQAEIAMSQVKKTGKNNFAVIEKQAVQNIERNRRLEFDLKEALDRKELYLLYQPEISLETGKIRGAEALLRWEHPELGNISPREFIPIAEETGMIHEIGKWTIEQAIKEAKKWHEVGLEIYLSVNLSYEQFKVQSLASYILETLEENDFDGHYFIVEITESLMKDLEHVDYMTQALKEKNIRIAVDDFGTGYSSLSTIGSLNVDLIKIDRYFIKNIPHDKKAVQMIKMIIKIAESLGSYVIAEGVEDREQALFLQENGCQYAQGYYYSRPVSPTDLLDNAKKS